jgi:hypothetical protein
LLCLSPLPKAESSCVLAVGLWSIIFAKSRAR